MGWSELVHAAVDFRGSKKCSLSYRRWWVNGHNWKRKGWKTARLGLPLYCCVAERNHCAYEWIALIYRWTYSNEWRTFQRKSITSGSLWMLYRLQLRWAMLKWASAQCGIIDVNASTCTVINRRAPIIFDGDDKQKAHVNCTECWKLGIEFKQRIAFALACLALPSPIHVCMHNDTFVIRFTQYTIAFAELDPSYFRPKRFILLCHCSPKIEKLNKRIISETFVTFLPSLM